MTEDQARQIKDPRNIPWNEGCFVFVPGRYYWGMWFIPIPKCKAFRLGGDITGQCWRFDGKPNEWIVTYRFRYYATSETWDRKWSDSKDKKNWWNARITADEAEFETNLALLFDSLTGTTGLFTASQPPNVKLLLFKGDCIKAVTTIQNSKVHWLHHKRA